jgi:DNA-binding GntR family transcriptional regulator
MTKTEKQPVMARQRKPSQQRASNRLPRFVPSRLQANLARRILQYLKEQDTAPGHHLVEKDLCDRFGVSRTPIRGALMLLAEQGMVESRANRGFVLREPVRDIAEEGPLRVKDEDAKRLFIAIAQARNSRTLPDVVPQQEFVRRFDARMPIVVQVLRQLADLGLVERKEGNGWSFAASINSAKAQADSYAFRRAVEPAMLLQPTFQLDRAWAEKTKQAHLAFRRRKWRDTDAVEFYEINADFHEHLARCSGNRYMHNAVQRQTQLRRFLNYQWEWGEKRVHESIDEHLEILAALESGWNDKAAALMLHHLNTSAGNTLPLDGDKPARAAS